MLTQNEELPGPSQNCVFPWCTTYTGRRLAYREKTSNTSCSHLTGLQVDMLNCCQFETSVSPQNIESKLYIKHHSNITQHFQFVPNNVQPCTMCAPLTICLRSTVLFTLLLCTLNLYYTVLIMLNKIQFNSRTRHSRMLIC